MNIKKHDLIRLFLDENTETIINPDKQSAKCSILNELWDYLDNDVIEFYICVFSNESEFDLARIEALRLVECIEIIDLNIKYKIKNALLTVLDSPDYDVRIAALSCAVRFSEFSEIINYAKKIILDEGQPSTIRFCALDILRPLSGNVPIIQWLHNIAKSIKDSDLRKTMERLANQS